MKRVNNIFEKIISIDNLMIADEMARKGKKNTYGVRLHDKNRESNIIRLHELLKSGNYKTSRYKVFKIFKPKEREIYCLPYYPDRIVHWAVMLQLESIWMNVFTADSYSCIKNRGIHGAARKVVKALQNKQDTQYCLKLDIKKFYPSISQDILMQIIERKIKCKKTLALLNDIVYSVKSGVPIGNYISQYAANLYLTYFDHWIKEAKGVKHYFRYCDDMVIFAPNKPYLHSLLNDIRQYLNDNLQLEVKSNYQVFPVSKRGVDFVGYKFYHTHTLVRKNIKKNMMRKSSRLRKRNADNKTYKMQMAAYTGWIIHDFVNSNNLLKKISA